MLHDLKWEKQAGELFPKLEDVIYSKSVQEMCFGVKKVFGSIEIFPVCVSDFFCEFCLYF